MIHDVQLYTSDGEAATIIVTGRDTQRRLTEKKRLPAWSLSDILTCICSLKWLRGVLRRRWIKECLNLARWIGSALTVGTGAGPDAMEGAKSRGNRKMRDGFLAKFLWNLAELVWGRAFTSKCSRKANGRQGLAIPGSNRDQRRCIIYPSLINHHASKHSTALPNPQYSSPGIKCEKGKLIRTILTAYLGCCVMKIGKEWKHRY